ncbi:MAG: restriction endonuclease subunit R, partial [Verrucomicrobiae bacterium]|nr:restriction endonuclease subunit R [Verrucomicrobiae bacterium]
MIGRGTRLCPNLFGPGEDKADFRVFDFCFNFDFFRENPEGINAGDNAPLGTRIFRARVDLLGAVRATRDLDPDLSLGDSLANGLHREVSAMSRDNFLVRMHLESVERFQRREVWENLGESDRETLRREIAGLPNGLPSDDLESRHFDLTALRMQLALAAGDTAAFESHRRRVVEIAALLEEKSAIPAVKAQLGYLEAIQQAEFWEGTTLAILEDMRLRLRELVPFIDRKKRKIVYTGFKDEVVGVRVEDVIAVPRMTSAQYEKKVADYLRNHLDDLAIHRLRSNQPLTPTDLKALETALSSIGEEDGDSLLSGLLARSGAPSLAHFVRSMVGMDQATAKAAFSVFLSDRSLTPPQIRFIEMVVEQLTSRGVMDASALYEPPFDSLHAGGPEELFAGKEQVVDGIFGALEALQLPPSSGSAAG